MVVVNLTAEHLLHGVNHSLSSGGQPVSAVTGMVPSGHHGGFALSVLAVVQAVLQVRILLYGTAHKRNLLRVEQTADQNITICLKSSLLSRGEDRGHGNSLVNEQTLNPNSFPRIT